MKAKKVILLSIFTISCIKGMDAYVNLIHTKTIEKKLPVKREVTHTIYFPSLFNGSATHHSVIHNNQYSLKN